jgi:amino acid transporter
LVALPTSEISMISGVPQALTAVATRIGMPVLGTVGAVLVSVSAAGGLGAWIMGTARLPFLFGLDRYLPRSLGAVHPKYGSPHIALLLQAGLTTIVLLAAVSGSTVREAYAVLIDMTVILMFVPLLYMFASLPVLRRRAVGDSREIRRIPGGPIASWLVTISGFSVTLIAVALSIVPPAGSLNPMLFVFKVAGGSVVLISVGLVYFFRGRAVEAASVAAH